MLRIGIVGAGTAGWVCGRHLRKIPGVAVTAICDPSGRKRAALSRKFKTSPALYADYRGLLAREALDGICNCTPDAVHGGVALAAIRHGVAVLSEKPMAVSVPEARRMQAAAQRQGGVAMINFSYRASGALARAARLIAAGRLGRILHVEASCLQSWLVSDYWGPWTAPSAVQKLSTRNGNLGALGDLGCHLLDLLTVLCGDIACVNCRLKRFAKGVRGESVRGVPLDANDSLAATLEFARGALGVIHASRWATGHRNSMLVRVFGDRGAIELDAASAPHAMRIVSGRRNIDRAHWRTAQCPPPPNVYARFVRAIKAERNAAPDFADGLRNQLLLEACLRSARTQQSVRVPVA